MKLKYFSILAVLMGVLFLAVCVTQVSADSLSYVTVSPKSSGSDTISPGATAYYNVKVVGSGSHAIWQFSIASGNNLPVGYTAKFTPTSINGPSGTVTLAITAPASASGGTYSFKVHCADSHDSKPSGNSCSTKLNIIQLVVPEYPLGALAALGACFAGLLVYKHKSLPRLTRTKTTNA
jgi:hypothetical protein